MKKNYDQYPSSSRTIIESREVIYVNTSAVLLVRLKIVVVEQ